MWTTMGNIYDNISYLTPFRKLNDNELRTLAVNLVGTPIPKTYVPELKEKLMNFSVNGSIVPESLENSDLRDNIKKAFAKKNRNK